MPFELPEARLVAAQLADELTGKQIQQIRLEHGIESLIRQGFLNLHQVDLTGRTVEQVRSNGKWIFLHLDDGLAVCLTLETGGWMRLVTSGEILNEKVTLQFDLNDGSSFAVRIIGYGFAKAIPVDRLESERYPGCLGISPLDEQAFTPEWFQSFLERNGSKILKAALLDQHQIAGIGNGYLQEILFRARLHPKCKAADLSASQRLELFAAIHSVLQEALENGGSASELDLYGRPGRFERMMVTQNKGQPCPTCGAAIEKIALLGSSCYVCPSCQPMPA